MGNTTSTKNVYVHYPSNFPCKQLEETSYSDLISLSNCIKSIKGQDSNSASPTDIYILTDSNYKTLFMKVFITGLDTTFSKNINLKEFMDNIYPLVYEYGVYLGKINKLVKYNICPFFVTTKGGSLHKTSDQLIEFLKTNLRYNDGKKVPISEIEDNFTRNVKTILNNMFSSRQTRLSISNNSKYTFPPEIENLKLNENYTFGYFITEGFSSSKPANDIFSIYNNYSNISTFDKNKFENYKQLILLFTFQMAIAFKSLELSKISNCDIHLGNVLFDTDLKISNLLNKNLTGISNKYVFFVENKTYQINLPFLIKIYDFDRSYIYGDDTVYSAIKNKHFSVDPTYNKSTLRDFLFPMTILIRELYDILKVIPVSDIDTIDSISDIINTLSYIVLKTKSLIPIKQTDINTSTVNSIPGDLSIRTSLDYVSSYSTLKSYSKLFITFIKQVEQTPFLLKDQNIRNRELHDDTFNTSSIFNNLDEIIDLIYNKIDSTFKNIFCNDNDCITDSDILKYYINSNSFDYFGILNKKELYKSINKQYSIFINDNKNKIVKLTQEIQTKDNELNIKFENYKNDLIKEYEKELEKYKDNLNKEYNEKLQQLKIQIKEENKNELNKEYNEKLEQLKIQIKEENKNELNKEYSIKFEQYKNELQNDYYNKYEEYKKKLINEYSEELEKYKKQLEEQYSTKMNF